MQKTKIALLLSILMIFSTVIPAFAVEFTDIADHWGHTHIQRMADRGIVSGSDDPITGERVYKPDDPVSKVEAIVMLYSMLREMDQLISDSDHTNRYQSIMTSAQIPEWAMRQVAYAIEAEIIRTTNLAGFMEDASPYPIQQSALREEVAIYFGKALDTEDETDSSAASLEFYDTEQIGSDALPYVNLLVEKNIISGDTENNFNPRQTITRAEMAALMSKAVEYLEDSEPIIIQLTDNDDEDEDEDEDEEITSVLQGVTRKEGTIQRVNHDTGIIFVEFDAEDELEIFEVTDETTIRINSLDHELINLRAGQKAEFSFNEDGDLVRIEISPRRSTVRGTLSQIVETGYQKALILDVNGNSHSFWVGDHTEVRIDSQSSRLERLSEGDELTVHYEGQNAIIIERGADQEDEYEVEGILQSGVNFDRYPYTISLRLPSNQIEEYEIHNNVTIRIDGNRGYLEDLTRGDIASLRIDPGEDHQVVRIDAEGLDRIREVDGTIRRLIIARPNQIDFIDKDQQENTYDLADSVRIYIENERSDLRDLNLPTSATIHIQNDRVVEIEAENISSSEVVQGRITHLHDSINRMIVRHRPSTASSYEEISVYVHSGTIIIDRDGSHIRMRDLTRDSEVFITGEYDSDAFIADRILVIN